MRLLKAAARLRNVLAQRSKVHSYGVAAIAAAFAITGAGTCKHPQNLEPPVPLAHGVSAFSTCIRPYLAHRFQVITMGSGYIGSSPYYGWEVR
jgi:hypothetical protein